MDELKPQPIRRRRLIAGSQPPKVVPKRRVTNHVYFLSCQGFIKIGTATCAKSRHRAVQTVSPFEVRLLCAIPGNAELERNLHRRFWHLHERGEWFRAAPGLEDYISGCLEKTKAANMAAWQSVARCDTCGKDTLCMVRRSDVEASVIPMQFFKEPSCFSCVLADANTYRAKALEKYYGFPVKPFPVRGPQS